MKKLILEFGDPNNTIDNLYFDYKIITLSKHDVSRINEYMNDIKFVVVNTSILNGNSVNLIQNIRRYYNGPLLVLIAAQDANLAKKFIDAGANDILYLGDVTREKVDKSIEFCVVKQRCKANLANLQQLVK